MITLIYLINFLVLFIKIHIYSNKLIQSVYSECVFIDDYLFDIIKANTVKVELKLNYTSLNNFQNFGMGLWIKYLPFLNDKNEIKFERRYFKNENGNLIQKSNGDQFVMLINNKQNKDIESILQMTRNPQTGCFEYFLSQNIEDQRQELVFSFSQNSFEGEWLMFYQYFDFIETKTHVTFWQTKTNVQEFKIINNIPNFKRIIEIQYGGFEIIEKIQGKQIDMQRYQGAISPPFVTFYQLFDQNDFQLCLDLVKFFTECRVSNITSIQFETIYLNNTYKQIASQYTYEHTLQNFYLNGWVKLDQLQNSKKQTLILRVSLSSNFNDDLYIGDKFFYLVYYQNMIQNQNGFELTTFSYEEPIFTQYTSKESDKIQDYSPQYEDRFTQWHMFQFQRDQSKNDGQPIFQFYFPKTGYQFFYFNLKINYFSLVKLYFSVGGDKYTKEYMLGYVSQFVFYSVCEEFDLYLTVSCHYSCLTCYGPNDNNCLSCPDDSYREYVLETQQCVCKIGYFDLMFYLQCLSMLNNLSQIKIIEQDTTKINLYSVFCQFGFFTFQNQCIQCPYYDDLKRGLQIQCANCYLNPLEFSQLLRCTINFISFDNDIENTYQIQELQESDVINFIIVKDLMNQYQIKQSKYGQYVYNQNFRDCSVNCQVCLDENICLKCHQNYEINHLGYCQLQINIVNVYENIACPIGQYLLNNQCLFCGQYCQQCDRFGLCQYCVDSKINYISFDGINCKNCTISDCQYCFDFYYQDNQVHLTLDNQFIFTQSNQIQIFQGCAQCQNDYFFNFNNLKCENKCSHLTNNDQFIECMKKYKTCYFGIINYNQDIICIKSIDSVDSIQNQNCEQIHYCQECIISQNIGYCSQCLIGYYLDLYSGSCKLCSENCSSCVMQNKLFKDEWKQELIAFSFYFINTDIQSFLGINGSDNSNYQLICKQCFNGYLLYENKCLKGCDSWCENCQIINGSPMCTKCVLTKFGYRRAISKDGVCLECSNMCSVCGERTPDEILNYNPYFIMKESNMINLYKKMFRIVYQRGWIQFLLYITLIKFCNDLLEQYQLHKLILFHYQTLFLRIRLFQQL